MADAKRSAAAKRGWANHCAGTSRSQTRAAKTTTKAGKAQPKPKAKAAARTTSRPVPIGRTDPHNLAPDATPRQNLHGLRELYGDDQLEAALTGRSLSDLRAMQKAIGAPSATTKAGLIKSVAATARHKRV